MSVLKNKRGLSKLEFYHNARKMRQDITNLLLRDFGVHDKVIREKGGEDTPIIEGFPDWLIVQFRTSMMNILRNMMMNITAGNTVYPTTMEELAERRRYQTAAIINCEQLLQELQYCADVLPPKLEKFLPFVVSVELEIKLLKGWRKSSNELAKKIKGAS
jgi:hypothetical protein